MCIDQIIRLIEALAWPVVAVIALFAIRPWRLITHLVDRGGKLEAAGVKIDLPAKIREAQTAAQAALPAGDAAQVEAAALTVDDDDTNAASIDAYSLIVSSWSELVTVMDKALEALGVDQRDWRSPAGLLNTLRDRGVLSNGLHEATRDLLDVRNQVKRNGPDRFSKLGITARDAERFAGSARTIQTTVEAWLRDKDQ